MLTYLRILRFGWLFGRYRLYDDFPEGIIPPIILKLLKPLSIFAPKDTSDGFAQVLEDSGPVFIKLGQFLSTRPDVVGYEVAKSLSRLQHSTNELPFRIIERQLTLQFGDALYELFAEIEAKPIASASLAQVHRGILKSGEAVAIKVLRPGINNQVTKDLVTIGRMMEHLARLERFRRYPLIDVHREFASTLRSECDLRLEAANTEAMAEDAANHNLLVLPRIYWDLSSREIMVSSFLEGAIPVNEVEQLRAMDVDLNRLAKEAVEVFFQQVFVDNFFHADMHPGNILVLPRGKDGQSDPCWAAVDCAVAGRLTSRDLSIVSRLLRLLLEKDYNGLAQLFISANWVYSEIPDAELPSRLRSVLEPILGRPLGELSYIDTLSEILAGTRVVGVALPSRLSHMLKTVASVEGLGKALYPELDIWSSLKEQIKKHSLNKFQPTVIKAGLENALQTFDWSILQLPDRLVRALEKQSSERPQTPPKSSSAAWGTLLVSLAIIADIQFSPGLYFTIPTLLTGLYLVIRR